VISYICFNEQGQIQKKDCFYEKDATFKGGEKEWRNWLSNKLGSAKLPDIYYSGIVYGTVYLQIVIDVDGKVTDIRVTKSVAPVLDAVAVDIIKESPRWEPAIQYNRRVKAYRTQPVTFLKAQ
jgi:protein TonB